jgi:DNA-binding NtrC family response regulator
VKPVLYLGCPTSERAGTQALLATADLDVIWADHVDRAIAELQRRDVPVLLDLSRGAGILTAARELYARFAAPVMFAVVDPRRPDLTTEAVLAGIADVFARPLGARRVAHAINREIGYRSRVAGSAAEVSGHDLYAHSPAMREVLALIARASTTRAGVMIQGEDGTGRQVVAKAIHAAQENSGRFLVVDCGMDAEDLETVLFGVRSRPSGAPAGGRGLERVSRSGRFHEASGGTLYLRHVADASSRVQARLARVLRDREALLAETGEPIALDVRPVAGVDPGFDEALQDGRIREDLFRRLSAIRIPLPPLRGRREDIPALANYFVREICAGLGMPPKTLSRPALSLMSALPWRGNGVEIRALLEQVVGGLPSGRAIGLDDVLAHVRLDGGAAVYAEGTLRQARARFERDYITSVLEQHHGRVSDAAKALGIQRTNLYRKIRSLRLTPNRRH